LSAWGRIKEELGFWKRVNWLPDYNRRLLEKFKFKIQMLYKKSSIKIILDCHQIVGILLNNQNKWWRWADYPSGQKIHKKSLQL
jgi:hypothetical protein